MQRSGGGVGAAWRLCGALEPRRGGGVGAAWSRRAWGRAEWGRRGDVPER